jgi:PEP-CTERM motif
MNVQRMVIAAAVGATVFVSGSVMAESISVQFQGNGSPIGTVTPPATATDPTGAFPVGGNFFNVVTGNTSNTGPSNANVPITVTSDTGDTSALTFNSPNQYGSGGGGTNNLDLLSGYLDNNGGAASSASLTLPAGIAGTGSTPYDVYLYIAGDTPGRFGTATINGGTPVTLIEGSQNGGTFVEAMPGAADGSTGTGGNYYEFTGVTGTTLSISLLGTNPGTPRLPFDGFQVVAETPEPASLSLLGVAGLGLLARRRR